MDLDLKNEVVLITGGASGIGAAIVRAVVCEGAIAVIADRCTELPYAMQEELGALGAKTRLVSGDLTMVENCKRAVETATSEFGRIDALVNNAGVNDRVGLDTEIPRRMLLPCSEICCTTTTWPFTRCLHLRNRAGRS